MKNIVLPFSLQDEHVAIFIVRFTRIGIEWSKKNQLLENAVICDILSSKKTKFRNSRNGGYIMQEIIYEIKNSEKNKRANRM